MQSTCTIQKYDDDSIYITATWSEDMIKTVIDKALEGYRLVPNTVNMTMAVKQLVMSKNESKTNPEPVVEAPVGDADKQLPLDLDDDSIAEQEVVEEVVEAPTETTKPTVTDAQIAALNGNKDKLEALGRTLGVELKKSKSFSNMVNDLKDALK